MFDHPEIAYIFEGISPEITLSVKEQIEKLGLLTTARLRGYQVESYQNLQVAGRLLIFDLRRHCSPTLLGYAEDIKDRIQDKYYQYIKEHHLELQHDIDKSVQTVYRNNDFFSFSSYKTNYLAKMSYDDIPCETPEYLYMRVAIQLHYEDGVDQVLKCYNEQLEVYYTMASPTLFNSCMKKNCLSSCFLGRFSDNLKSILETGAVEFGLISKASGAFGVDISQLRHSQINGSGESSGVMPWLQILNSVAIGCNQEGRRPGSCAVSMRTHHIDIEQFVKVVQKIGDRYETAHNINTVVYANQIFFDRVKTKGKWTLFCPAHTRWLNDIYGDEFTQKYIETEKLAEERELEYQRLKNLYDSKREDYNFEEFHQIKLQYIEAKKNRIKHKVINAVDLFLLICSTQRMAGLPYLNACDSINYKCNQKNLGYISNQNLCQEICLRSSSEEIASCNLGSISLSKFAKSRIDRTVDINSGILGAYNFRKLSKTMWSMVDNLDNVIEYNCYPLDEWNSEGKLIPGKIRTTNFKNRPIGIGVQGFAEVLYITDLRIEDDKEYVDLLNKMIFACMYFNAMAESIQLAIKKGKYSTFEGSPLSEGKFQFDLWTEEFKIRGPNKVRPSEPKIIEPCEWKQEAIPLNNGDIILPTWNDLRRCVMKYGVRNSMLIALMPTATSSQILRGTECFEMPSSNLYSRVLMGGNYPVLNRFLVSDFEELGIWNALTLDYLRVSEGSIKGFDDFLLSNLEKYSDFNIENIERVKFLVQKFKTMWEISQRYMIHLASMRGRYVCHSASLNIYLASPTDEQLMASHLVSNDEGLKTLMYYLRQKSSIKGVKFTVDPEIAKYITESMKENIKLDVNTSKEKKAEKELVIDTSMKVCDPRNKECLSCT